MSLPTILTAIPQRRYQFGEFQITVLGEIEAGDGRDYRYLLAVARDGEPRPNLFLSAEKVDGGNRSYAMRVSMAEGSQVVQESERWSDMELFVRDGLDIVRTMLDLGDEMPVRLD